MCFNFGNPNFFELVSYTGYKFVVLVIIMLGQVLRVQYEITESGAVYTWMGQMLTGDQVIDVHKLDPTTNGISSRYWLVLATTRPCAALRTISNMD